MLFDLLTLRYQIHFALPMHVMLYCKVVFLSHAFQKQKESFSSSAICSRLQNCFYFLKHSTNWYFRCVILTKILNSDKSGALIKSLIASLLSHKHNEVNKHRRSLSPPNFPFKTRKEQSFHES